VNGLAFVNCLQELILSGVSFVQVTLVSVKGSAPQDVGAKALILETGLHFGTVGGGKVEAFAIQYGQRILKEEYEPVKQLVTWNLQKDIGMTCGGEVTFFFEAHSTRAWLIAVFGAGHIAQSLIPILVDIDCLVHCVVPRQEWLDRLPKKSNLILHCIEDPQQAISVAPKGAFICLMTKGHSTDLPILKLVLKRDFPFVGMIGSQTKAFRVRKELQRSGFSKEDIDRLTSPIGLPIGSNHPTEIAISIMAQLLQVRDNLGVV